MANNISLPDFLELRSLALRWAESYDAKDWDALKSICAPAVTLDYRALQGELKENVSPEDVAATIFDKKVIGDPRVKTQHLLGGFDLKVIDDTTVVVNNQLRVAHQRYATDNIMSEVVNKGHAHGYAQHTYQRINGVWKLAGVKPSLLWFEHDLFGTLNPDGA